MNIHIFLFLQVNCFGSGRIFPSPRSPKPMKQRPSPLSFSPQFHFSPLSPAKVTNEPKKSVGVSLSSGGYAGETRSAFEFVGSGISHGGISMTRDVGVQCTLLPGRPLVWPPPPATPSMVSGTLPAPGQMSKSTTPVLPPPSPSLASCAVASRTFPIHTDENRCTDSPDSITIEVHDYG